MFFIYIIANEVSRPAGTPCGPQKWNMKWTFVTLPNVMSMDANEFDGDRHDYAGNGDEGEHRTPDARRSVF